MSNDLIDALQPNDWNEEDGEWTTPTMANPKYKGPWKPKLCGGKLWSIDCC